MREIVFEVAADRKAVKQGELPLGEVRGIIVPGYGESRSRWVGRGVSRLVTELPDTVATRLVDFRRRYLTGEKNNAYNCLGFMAFSQGREIGIDEHYRMTGPELVPGRFVEVNDITRLKPGAEYGFPDSEGYLIHGTVGLSEFDRNVGVDETGGSIVVSSTSQTVQEYLVGCGHPARLVELQANGYQSSELIRPADRALV